MARQSKKAQAEGAGRRRPTAADMPAIFDMIEDGKSLASACRHFGFDPPSARKLIDAEPELAKSYAAAVEGRGDYYGEQVLNTAAGVVTGAIKPDVGRVAMDGFKWAAGRMAPKRWGDKVQAEVTGKDGAPLQAAAPVVIFSLPDNGRS